MIDIEVLTIEEVSKLLKVSKQQVRRMVRSGEISAIKVGREWRITNKSLTKFLTGLRIASK